MQVIFASLNFQMLAIYFRKRVKRDPTLCNQLKDHMQRDQKHRHKKISFRLKNFDEVMDVHCNSYYQEDIDMIDEQKKLMCSVFERSLLTYQGKSIARSHETDCNAQEVKK